jgi:NTP pyrophosphatase (non-canonical NTP hydrolase)
VAEFVSRHQLQTGIETRLLDLLSELGELAKETLKGSHYGSRATALTPDWESELADVFFSLICLANDSGMDLDQALNAALKKYEQRIQSAGEAGSGR